MEKTVWLSYYFGVTGDYPEFYTWLDSKGAKECGGNLAIFKYGTADVDLAESLKLEIDNAIKNASSTRIYIVFRDEETGKNKGKFLFGGRKAPLWAGYARLTDQEDDDGD